MSLKKTLTKALTGVALASSLYGLPARNANALEIVYPNGLVVEYMGTVTIDSKQSNHQSNSTSNLYKEKQEQKHYDWIKPDRYSDWQCAYELVYDEDEKPYGFKLYVDVDGDRKPDEEFEYNIMHIKPFFNGIRYRYELDWDELKVGGGWREDLKRALNVCGIDAMRKIFYLRGDTVSDPEDFRMGKPVLEKTYPSITFYK
jgi:hypothetical protein